MERNAIFIIHCLILSLLVIVAATKDIATDQQALLALKAHITDDPSFLLAKNWTSNTSVCSWIGITCDVHSHRVTTLNISHLSLTGTIPSQLGNLSSLQILDLSYNQLSGEIPKELGNLAELEMVKLTFNQFTGRIPRDIANLTSLKILNLGNNNLMGEIPYEVGNHHNLETLKLSENNLVGFVPASIFNLSTMKALDVNLNALSASLPPSKDLTGLPNVEGLYLLSNNFTGEFQVSSSMLLSSLF